MTALRTISGLALALAAMPAAIAQAPMAMPAMPAPGAGRPVIVPPCAPPAEFAHWGQRHAVAAAIRIGGEHVPELVLDDSVDLALAPIGSLVLAVPLGKPMQPGDHGGIVRFRATMTGTYRIALGGRAWIDVARGPAPLASVAHAMGPACAGIAKLVDFQLVPGDYTIQLSAAVDPAVRIAIARLP